MGPVDCVLMLPFKHLVFPGVGWMAAGLLMKVGEAMGQAMEVKVQDSAGCASGRPHSTAVSGGGPYSAGCVLLRPNWDGGQILL